MMARTADRADTGGMIGYLFLTSALVGLVAMSIGRACLRHHTEQESRVRRSEYRTALAGADGDALTVAMLEVALCPRARVDMMAAIDTAGALAPRALDLVDRSYASWGAGNYATQAR
jgi:hypothetical protein